MLRIGRIIRAFRVNKQLSLKELAAKVDISPSYLSQIENEQVNMSLDVLEGISQALGTPIHTFFLQDDLDSISFVKEANRDRVIRRDGATMERLTNNKSLKFDITIVTYPMQYQAPEYAIHPGEEFVLVLEGTLSIDLSELASYSLEVGDSLAFPSKIPHKISSENGARVLIHSSTLPITFV